MGLDGRFRGRDDHRLANGRRWIGRWFVYADGNTAADPEMVAILPFTMPEPPQGGYAAVTDMNGWGKFILYRDVSLDGAFALHVTAFYETSPPRRSSATHE